MTWLWPDLLDSWPKVPLVPVLCLTFHISYSVPWTDLLVSDFLASPDSMVMLRPGGAQLSVTNCLDYHMWQSGLSVEVHFVLVLLGPIQAKPADTNGLCPSSFKTPDPAVVGGE